MLTHDLKTTMSPEKNPIEQDHVNRRRKSVTDASTNIKHIPALTYYFVRRLSFTVQQII